MWCSVSYLAGEFVESIQKRQPELEISDVDILCIKMAGLCHDLGMRGTSVAGTWEEDSHKLHTKHSL